MDDSDKDKWKDAMNQEMESMHSNSVWELLDLPEDVKPVTPRPDEVHSTCNCMGAYVHQVRL